MGYYAVMPYYILEDERLKPNEKLLYLIISGLAVKEGYCYASNQTLAKPLARDGKAPSISSVSKWVSNLASLGYIRNEIIYEDDRKTVKERRLYIVNEKIIAKESKTPQTVVSKEDYNKDVEEVITYLNTVTGKNFNPKSSTSKTYIVPRLKEGYEVDDFKKIIQAKLRDDFFVKNHNRLINPKSLFKPTTFDVYLNEWAENKYEYDLNSEEDISDVEF